MSYKYYGGKSISLDNLTEFMKSWDENGSVYDNCLTEIKEEEGKIDIYLEFGAETVFNKRTKTSICKSNDFLIGFIEYVVMLKSGSKALKGNIQINYNGDIIGEIEANHKTEGPGEDVFVKSTDFLAGKLFLCNERLCINLIRVPSAKTYLSGFERGASKSRTAEIVNFTRLDESETLPGTYEGVILQQGVKNKRVNTSLLPFSDFDKQRFSLEKVLTKEIKQVLIIENK